MSYRGTLRPMFSTSYRLAVSWSSTNAMVYSEQNRVERLKFLNSQVAVMNAVPLASTSAVLRLLPGDVKSDNLNVDNKPIPSSEAIVADQAETYDSTADRIRDWVRRQMSKHTHNKRLQYTLQRAWTDYFVTGAAGVNPKSLKKLAWRKLPSEFGSNGLYWKNYPEDVRFPPEVAAGRGISALTKREMEVLCMQMNDPTHPMAILKATARDGVSGASFCLITRYHLLIKRLHLQAIFQRKWSSSKACPLIRSPSLPLVECSIELANLHGKDCLVCSLTLQINRGNLWTIPGQVCSDMVFFMSGYKSNNCETSNLTPGIDLAEGSGGPATTDDSPAGDQMQAKGKETEVVSTQGLSVDNDAQSNPKRPRSPSQQEHLSEPPTKIPRQDSSQSVARSSHIAKPDTTSHKSSTSRSKTLKFSVALPSQPHPEATGGAGSEKAQRRMTEMTDERIESPPGVTETVRGRHGTVCLWSTLTDTIDSCSYRCRAQKCSVRSAHITIPPAHQCNF